MAAQDKTEKKTEEKAEEKTNGSRGSCHCGQNVFEIPKPARDLYLCYCNDCQKQMGSPVGSWAFVLESDFKFVKENTKKYYLSGDGKGIYAKFCQNCGANIVMKYPKEKESDPEIIWYSPVLLENRDWFVKDKNHIFHLFVQDSSKPKWFTLPNDGYPRSDTVHGDYYWVNKDGTKGAKVELNEDGTPKK